MFLVSSNLMNKIEQSSPVPVINNDRHKPTNIVKGKKIDIFCPEIITTIPSGIKPIMKFMKVEIAVEKANTWGGIAIFVKTPPFLAIESAVMTTP